MFELFWAMMKEEWRLHSTMFGSVSFALFPVLILAISFMGSFLIPLMEMTIPSEYLLISIHASYLMLGLMVGGFGLLGNEVMNRRFAQASLLAYSARSLPISEKSIFANFVVKDTIYYFFLWVFPFAFGYIAASPFTGVSISSALLLLLTLTLAFLFGLCGMFFLSIIYTRSKPVLWSLLLLGIGWMGFIAITGTNPALLFPPILLYSHFTWMNFLLSSVALAFFFIISTLLFNPESVGSEKKHKELFSPFMERFSFLPSSYLVAKDIVDLRRSGSIVGHVIFAFILPLLMIWFFLSLLSPYLPLHGMFFIFALISGVIASTIYTWITMFDTAESYACLPIAVRTLIVSKLTTFSLFQLLPLVFISLVTILTAETAYLFQAIVLTLSVSFYAASVMIWLSGLSPNTMMYDVKVFAVYLLAVGIVLLLLIILAFMNPSFTLLSVLLAIPTWLLIERAKVRWDFVEAKIF
jgi:hypothetical protein